jgi:hypothetical protein
MYCAGCNNNFSEGLSICACDVNNAILMYFLINIKKKFQSGIRNLLFCFFSLYLSDSEMLYYLSFHMVLWYMFFVNWQSDLPTNNVLFISLLYHPRQGDMNTHQGSPILESKH